MCLTQFLSGQNKKVNAKTTDGFPSLARLSSGGSPALGRRQLRRSSGFLQNEEGCAGNAASSVEILVAEWLGLAPSETRAGARL